MQKSQSAVAFLETASRKLNHQARAPIERMVRVYAALKAHRAINCNSLAEELEVSPRSVGRDIEFMRDRLQLPIDYDAAQHSYVYAGGAR